jgi:diguanylate cyclase (GGDEF)-like protein
MSRPAAPAPSRALRLARSAWRLLHVDSAQSITLAEQALACAGDDMRALAWARLARAYHLLYFTNPVASSPALTEAREACDRIGDRAGAILAGAGLSRAAWRSGRFREALDLVLPLRDEGLAVLRDEQRSVLLNTIAGCYSALGASEQAFAYMYEALQHASPRRGHGYDAVLHCNLANELLQLGDCHEALRHIDDGLARCSGMANPRLLSVLLINRVICLTELARPREALADIERVRALPTDASGRGSIGTHFETLAIAALQAGEIALGTELVAAAQAVERPPIPDEHVELAIACALLAHARHDCQGARAALTAAESLIGPPDAAPREGLSLRMRCMYWQLAAELHEHAGRAGEALAAMRAWQAAHVARVELASRARYQAASLQTELLRLARQRDAIEERRRDAERARRQLAAINQQLSQRVEEVQQLKAALEQQAVRDFLTGLFNRRHLSDVLPQMQALARRDGEPLAVAIIDLDHFKQVNDRHGHAVGDRVLEAFGRLLADGLRRSDVACRYGGEEFCVLMPRTDAHAARRKIDALRRSWRAMSFEVEGGVIRGASFSAGIADSFALDGAAERLLKAADDCALDAKRRGRNQSVVFAAARSPAIGSDHAPVPVAPEPAAPPPIQ